MKAARLFVSDIDGTLVRKDKSLSDIVVGACLRLQAAGVSMSLISARPPSGMIWIAKKLGLTGPLAAFNGGTILYPDGNVVAAARLSVDAAACALETIARPGIVRWVFSHGRWYSDTAQSLYEASERRSSCQEPSLVTGFEHLLGGIDKIVAVSSDYELLAGLEREVAGALGADASVMRSQPYYLDITAPLGNKGDGINMLALAFGVPLADVAVIGDQRNDIDMFRRAGLSIAMGQSPEEVRQAAVRVTRSNEADGVAYAIDTLLFPKISPDRGGWHCRPPGLAFYR